MSETVERYDPPPYEHQNEKTAWRGGQWSARHGVPRKANPYVTGLGVLAWLAGYDHEVERESHSQEPR